MMSSIGTCAISTAPLRLASRPARSTFRRGTSGFQEGHVHPGAPPTLGHNDGPEFLGGPGEIVVHDDVLIFRVVPDLLPRPRKTPPNVRLGVAVPLAQPPLQDLPGGRDDKHEHAR